MQTLKLLIFGHTGVRKRKVSSNTNSDLLVHAGLILGAVVGAIIILLNNLPS